MLRASFPIGRFMNVAVRVHISFPLLLALAVGYSVALTGNATRGIGLWCALCLAVLVRETARALAAAYAGLRPRALFLLPVGGLMAFSTHDGAPPPATTRLFPWVGPAANLAAGLLLFGATRALIPEVDLLSQPWISTGHILRSVIWMQVVLGACCRCPRCPRRPPRRTSPSPLPPRTTLPAVSPSVCGSRSCASAPRWRW
jgi:hypothetical protein